LHIDEKYDFKDGWDRFALHISENVDDGHDLLKGIDKLYLFK